MFHKASLQAVPSEHLPAAHALRRPLPGAAPSLRLEDAGDAKPAWITLLTTEHYNLQMKRVSTISESNGRASVFLGAVSAGLIALGFESTTRGAGPVGRMIFPVSGVPAAVQRRPLRPSRSRGRATAATS